jgi:hypothetical protein
MVQVCRRFFINISASKIRGGKIPGSLLFQLSNFLLELKDQVIAVPVPPCHFFVKSFQVLKMFGHGVATGPAERFLTGDMVRSL